MSYFCLLVPLQYSLGSRFESYTFSVGTMVQLLPLSTHFLLGLMTLRLVSVASMMERDVVRLLYVVYSVVHLGSFLLGANVFACQHVLALGRAHGLSFASVRGLEQSHPPHSANNFLLLRRLEIPHELVRGPTSCSYPRQSPRGRFRSRARPCSHS